jgi:hypothetical protein
MATGAENELLEEAHELMANAFLAVVLLHVGGLVAHALRHHDRLAVSMVTGRKQGLSPDQPAVQSRPFVGLVFVVLTGLSAAYLLRQTLRLGESETNQQSSGADEDRHEAENEHE